MSFNEQSVTTDRANSPAFPNGFNTGESEEAPGGVFPHNYPVFPNQSTPPCSSESDSEEGQEEAGEEEDGQVQEKVPEKVLLQKQRTLKYPNLAQFDKQNFVVVPPKSKKIATKVSAPKVGNSIIDIVESRKRSQPPTKTEGGKAKKERKRRETAAEKEERKKVAFFQLMEKLYHYSKFNTTMDSLNLNVPF